MSNESTSYIMMILNYTAASGCWVRIVVLQTSLLKDHGMHIHRILVAPRYGDSLRFKHQVGRHSTCSEYPLLNQTPQAQTLAQNPTVSSVQSSKLLSVADPRHLFTICKPTELQANHVRESLSDLSQNLFDHAWGGCGKCGTGVCQYSA